MAGLGLLASGVKPGLCTIGGLGTMNRVANELPKEFHNDGA